MSISKRLIIDHGKPLVLTFDAFGTLFRPREPIARLYAQAARRHGLTGFTDDEVGEGFRKAYKAEYAKHPNYGKASGMSPSTWWSKIKVIHGTLAPYAAENALPEALSSDLWDLFGTKRGYELFPDVLAFFQSIAKIKEKKVFPCFTTGIISNSDDRVPSVISSLGLRISSKRHGIAVDPEIDLRNETFDFDFVAMSYDVGFSKPASEIFDAALALSDQDVPAEAQLIHVGDDIEQDYCGAVNAGWQATILENRRSEDRAAAPEGIVCLQDLDELSTLLSLRSLKTRFAQ